MAQRKPKPRRSAKSRSKPGAAMRRPPDYPNVACVKHAPEPGYIVCGHVRGGAAAAQFEAASPKDLGIILCAGCSVLDKITDPRVDGMLVCSPCAVERGFVPGTQLS